MHKCSRSPVLFNQDTQGLRVREDSIGIQAKVELTLGVLPTAIPGGEDPQRRDEPKRGMEAGYGGWRDEQGSPSSEMRSVSPSPA